MSTFIYTHEACFKHRPGPYHPESPERLQAVLTANIEVSRKLAEVANEREHGTTGVRSSG